MKLFIKYLLENILVSLIFWIVIGYIEYGRLASNGQGEGSHPFAHTRMIIPVAFAVVTGGRLLLGWLWDNFTSSRKSPS